MSKRLGKYMATLAGLFVMSGCQTNEVVDVENFTLFPTPQYAWVGDPMPYYENGKFNVFYLHDARSGTGGFHPWALLQTENFYEYKDAGEVIPFVNDVNDQELALGTGSVIKVDETYHAFYTAHNSYLNPKEAIMHAISSDMISWTKIEEDTFYADAEYKHNDFRDPYVFYNELENNYWMLITTRKENDGVIALYTSNDLKAWQNEGVLFENDMGSDSNLECPTLIKYNDYWYLTFSDQWPDRLVHYRMATNPRGPFVKPDIDVFDGAGFYAGRLEKSEDELFLFGWVPTKFDYLDESDFDWGGNLVVHQLAQKEDGTLTAIPIKDTIDIINKKVSLIQSSKSSNINVKKNNYQTSGSGYEVITFDALPNISKLTGEIKISDETKLFGFSFNVENQIGGLNIVFNSQTQQLEFYNGDIMKVSQATPQIKVPLSFDKGDVLFFTMIIENNVASLYVNDEIVLTTRMFGMPENEWGLFALDSKVEFNNIKLSTLEGLNE